MSQEMSTHHLDQHNDCKEALFWGDGNVAGALFSSISGQQFIFLRGPLRWYKIFEKVDWAESSLELSVLEAKGSELGTELGTELGSGLGRPALGDTGLNTALGTAQGDIVGLGTELGEPPGLGTGLGTGLGVSPGLGTELGTELGESSGLGTGLGTGLGEPTLLGDRDQGKRYRQLHFL